MGSTIEGQNPAGPMKQCPYCGHSNYDWATECRKCQASFVPQPARFYKPLRVGPEKARALRNKAIVAVVLGLLIKIYFGGQDYWPVIANPTLASIRAWLEPILLYGGVALYLAGFVLRKI